MREFRAKDADRDRAVEVIEAAYVGGQLGDADRELRVSRARSAETVDELTGLTRDLRERPVPPLPAEPAVRPAATRSAVTHSPAGRSKTIGIVVAGLAAAGVLGVVPFALLATGSSDYTSAGPVESPMESSRPAAEEAVTSFEMTPAGVRRFVRAHQREFGRPGVYGVVLYPTRVQVDVPVVRAGRPRMAGWRFDGTWREAGAMTAVISPAELVDLGTLDVGGLFANIAKAKKVLRVPQGELTHVVVRDREGEQPTVNIYVANDVGQSGYLSTTPSGEEIRRFPAR